MSLRLSPEQRIAQTVQRGAPEVCWPWRGAVSMYGYGRMRGRDSGRTELLAHRVAYELANGPIPAGLLVRHSCDNPPCCNPAHLLLGTHGDNRQDCVSRERQSRGERVNTHVLTEAEVVDLRDLRAKGWTYIALGRVYGISRQSARAAALGLTWKHVAAANVSERAA